MGRNAKKKKPSSHGKKKYLKSKRSTKLADYDLVWKDNQPENKDRTLAKYVKGEETLDDDLPGLGQFYCISCARYFVDRSSIEEHYKAKSHKKRLKQLQTEKPWTTEDALGMKIDNGRTATESMTLSTPSSTALTPDIVNSLRLNSSPISFSFSF